MGSSIQDPAPWDKDPIVVVGFAFRFPQDAVTEDDFWTLLRNGETTMTEPPGDRFNIDGHYSRDTSRQDTVWNTLSILN